jgi:hypothetical protein
MYIMIHVCHHSSVHAHVGPEPSSAQKRRRLQTDEELADYRQLRKLFKLKKGVNASDVLAPLVAAGPSAMQVPEGLLRQAWACLNRILIIKTELRSIILGVPILGAR